MKYNFEKWKRVLLFSFLIFFAIFKSQTFIRSSDEKTFDSIVILHKGVNILVNKSNFKAIDFDRNDKVLYNNKSIDFSISRDTLFFFDKVKEIEEVHITNENLDNKKEKTIISRELKYNGADIFPNNLIATYIKIAATKKTFVKSIVFFPELLFFPHDIKGNIDIQILPNVNGFPDINNPILSFQRDISETVNKKWEIVLPRIIKYPNDGFFVTFYYLSDDKKRTTVLKLNRDTYMYFYYPQTKEWKKATFNGYFYKLRILH